MAHHGAEFPSTVVHRSLSRPPTIKGNTQLPQLPVPVVFEEGYDVDIGDGDGVGDGEWCVVVIVMNKEQRLG